MHVWNVLHATRRKYRTEKIAKNRHGTIAQLCPAISSQLSHVSTIGKKLVKQQYLLHMSAQYCELRPTSGWDRFESLQHPSKFQRATRLGFVTAPTSLNGGQQNFAGCLAISWTGTLYIHFGGSCPLTEFCQLQNSLCFQVLRSPTLAALLHGTRAVSQTLCRGTWNGITELSKRVPPIFSWAAITLGISPHSSLWPPYVIGQAIYIFSSCGFFLPSFFFPRLISAVGDWMSTILPHMVWP